VTESHATVKIPSRFYFTGRQRVHIETFYIWAILREKKAKGFWNYDSSLGQSIQAC